ERKKMWPAAKSGAWRKPRLRHALRNPISRDFDEAIHLPIEDEPYSSIPLRRHTALWLTVGAAKLAPVSPRVVFMNRVLCGQRAQSLLRAAAGDAGCRVISVC